MKKETLIFFAVLSPSAALAQAPPVQQATQSSADNRWQAVFNSETRYFTWTSSRGFPTTPTIVPQPPTGPGRGSQIYNPFALELTGRPNDDFKLELLARGGYFWSRQSAGGFSGEASGTTDTTFAATTTYYGWTGFQPFVKVSVNAPTGQTRLTGNATFARADSDVVDTPTFGEGWNIGPTIGANIPITANLLVSIGVGATYRGAYDREAFTPADAFVLPSGTDRINPGDVTTFNAGVTWQVGQWTLQGSAFYSLETQTSLNNAPFYKSGNRVYVTSSAGYAWNDHWSSNLSGSFNHTDRNKIAMAGLPELVVEAFDFNSDVTTATFGTTYKDGPLSIGPTASFMFRDHNAWSPMFLRFLPAKTSWALGATAGYQVAKLVTINGRVERRWTHEDDNPDKFAANNLPPIIAGTGIAANTNDSWLLLFGGVIKFGGS